jgi:hypothetical protein
LAIVLIAIEERSVSFVWSNPGRRDHAILTSQELLCDSSLFVFGQKVPEKMLDGTVKTIGKLRGEEVSIVGGFP